MLPCTRSARSFRLRLSWTSAAAWWRDRPGVGALGLRGGDSPEQGQLRVGFRRGWTKPGMELPSSDFSKVTRMVFKEPWFAYESRGGDSACDSRLKLVSWPKLQEARCEPRAREPQIRF